MDYFSSQFGFELVDEKLFDQFSDVKPTIEEVKYNYCPDCNIPMILSGCEYQCGDCGQVQQFSPDSCKDHGEAVNGSIRITTGANKGRFYNITSDYSKTQKKLILDQLMANRSSFSGNAFPIDVLDAAATQYNMIQKMITEDDVDIDGKIRGQKKFVRRGNIKDEVLAALIYFECVRKGLVRKKKDIAKFMKLPNNGFSRGEDCLRNLHAEEKIDIPIDEEPISGFSERYLESLGLDNPMYNEFINEIVEESERKKIGMNSQVSSKIVSAIWVLVVKCKLNISAAEIEKACDNTKKNTFMKFYKCIFDQPIVFMPVFKRHGVKW